MPVTIQLEDDLVDYFKEYGKFGENYCDVLRRLLPGYRPSKNPPVPAPTIPGESHSPHELHTQSAGGRGRNAYPPVFGHSVTNVVRALGAAGWSRDEATQALARRGIQANPDMIKTQIAWGKQWGKQNPHCRSKNHPYGTEPPRLTDEQLRELRGE